MLCRPADIFEHVCDPAGMGAEPVDLLHVYGKRVVRRWRHGGAGPWDLQEVHLGVLPDGRWYVYHVASVSRPSYAYPDQREALDGALKAMAERPAGWEEVEPYPHGP